MRHERSLCSSTFPVRAPPPGHEPEKLAAVMEACHDADGPTRCQIAGALGEWGGRDAAVALSELLRSEQEETVVLYCVTALRTIEGPDAVRGLQWVIEHGTEVTRDAALSALEELVTDGQVDDAEAPVPLRSSAGTIRTRGAVRTHGAAARRSAGSPAGSQRDEGTLADTLRRVRDSESSSVVALLVAKNCAGVNVIRHPPAAPRTVRV